MYLLSIIFESKLIERVNELKKRNFGVTKTLALALALKVTLSLYKNGGIKSIKKLYLR